MGRRIRHGLMGLAAVGLLAGCAAPERAAAPAESAPAESIVASPAASPAPVDVASSAPLPTENAAPVKVWGFRSSRICIENRDEVGVWRNYVDWTKFDTNTGSSSVFGESVCAEGSFAGGLDVVGELHLSDGTRSNFLDATTQAFNAAAGPPWLVVQRPGSDERTIRLGEGESLTQPIRLEAPGMPPRQLRVKRLANTDWIEWRVTVENVAACQPGGACAIGDTGPGGGVVFYDAGAQQPWGRYLEAAPNGWNGGNEDPVVAWCAADSEGFDLAVPTQSALGAGKANTSAIVEACGTGKSAAGLASAYRGGGKADWYLPSREEVDALHASPSIVPGLAPHGTWSSSQANKCWDEFAESAKCAWAFDRGWKHRGEEFRAFDKASLEHGVRPIRAF